MYVFKIVHSLKDNAQIQHTHKLYKQNFHKKLQIMIYFNSFLLHFCNSVQSTKANLLLILSPESFPFVTGCRK